MVGHGGRSAGSYLADPTSPIPSHCASIVATSTVRVNVGIKPVKANFTSAQDLSLLRHVSLLPYEPHLPADPVGRTSPQRCTRHQHHQPGQITSPDSHSSLPLSRSQTHGSLFPRLTVDAVTDLRTEIILN